MPALHAVQKMLAAHSRPVRSTVDAGEFLEIEPDVFSVIISFNPTEAEHLARDLEELGMSELPLRERIVAFSDHGSPAANSSIATGHKRWRNFYRAHGVKVFDGGAGISHVVLPEQGIAVPGGAMVLRCRASQVSGARAQ